MESLAENAPDIIASAATNPLGLAALVIIVSGVIALYWFRKSADWLRLSIFSLLFVGGLLFAYASGLETPTVIGPVENNGIDSPIVEDAGDPFGGNELEEKESLDNTQNSINPRTVAQVGEEGYTFSLYSCSRNTRSDLNCVLKVENNEGERRNLTLYNSYYQEESKAIDGDGKIYLVESLVFGSTPDTGSVTQEMTQNVPVEAEIAFSDVPEELTTLRLVELLFAHPGPRPFIVQFFDVPLSI